MENEAFVEKEMEQHENGNGVTPKIPKRRYSKKYSVKLEDNNVELSALSKSLPIPGNEDDDSHSRISAAVRHGRRSLIRQEIDRARENNTLDNLDSVGFSPLHHTTRYCRLEAIEDLLKSGADVNLKSRDDHFTALHIASRFGWFEAIQILLKHGADVSLHANNGATALHLACRKGCPKTIELLLKQRGIDINARDNLLRTPLHLAASQGHNELIHLLIENGADVFALSADKTSSLYLCLMNEHGSKYTRQASTVILKKAFERATKTCFMSGAHDMNGFTLTHIAAGTNAIEVVKMALDRGANVNVANVNNGITPLHVACRKGFLEMVELLIQRGADINTRDLQCRTSLHHAAAAGHDQMVRFLIDTGAIVDARDCQNMTPFLAACSRPKAKPSTVQILVEEGADVHASEAFMKNCLHLAVECENYEMTKYLLRNETIVKNLYSPDVCERVALHYAAKSGSLEILKLLLTKQQTLNSQDEDQKTAIYLAAKANRLEHVVALGQAGASVNERDDEGMTALHAAASKPENRKVCKILISLGADVNSKDGRNRTPLMLAAEAGCVKTVKAMLKLNARIDDVSLDGHTALLSAVRKNNGDVVRLLMDRNAKVTHRDLSGAGVFETATKYNARESVKALCCHERWREVLTNTTSPQGQRPMEILIQYFPEAAEAVMNKCMSRTKCDLILPTHKDYKITYDVTLLDPGPDDPDFVSGKRYFGPATMVKYMRQDLLLHPLTQKLLEIKWASFGSYFYYLSLFLYFWYMVGYSYFVVSERGREFPRNFTKITVSKVYTTSRTNHRIALMIIVFAAFQLFREVIQIVGQRQKYFKQPENALEWALYGLSIVFVLPYVGPDAIHHSLYSDMNDVYNMWILAIISIFLSYMNFVLFLRRFTLFGIYITMFLVVLRSLLKVMIVFMEFMVAFAVVFYILFKEQPSFKEFSYSVAKTIAMSVGEIDFTTTFIDSVGQNNTMTRFPLNPFPHLGFVFSAIFISTMSITLMNLLIGLAIGDIDHVQRSAELQRLSMQVEFVAEIEEKYPRFITRRLYKPVIDIMPNKKTIQWRLKRIQRSFQGALKDLTLTTCEASTKEAEVDMQLDGITETLEKNRRQIKALVTAMETQATMIKSMAEKMDSYFKISKTEPALHLEERLEEIKEENDQL